MLDVEELEKQWKQYKRNQRKPFYLVGFVFAIIVSLVLLVLNNKIKINNFDINKTIKSFSFFDKSKQHNKNENNIQISNKIKRDLNKYLLNDPIKDMFLIEETKKNIKNNTNVTPLDDDDLYVEKDISKPIIKKKKVSIIKISTNSAYKDVERRFKRSHNINDSMFLANMYYKRKNYRKAIYWAMQTNKLDKNIEESWLIFAKSKVKLGKKNEAISVLKAYIKRSNSYEARKLLKKIMNS